MSYSHKDEPLRDQLETHLAMLKREGVIDVWHDRRIPAGDEIDHRISEKLEQAHVVLLLVSPDFLASPYCFDVELRRAMQRHAARNARVIPVILRPCDWHSAPFGKLAALPTDGKPITRWPDRDDAFLDVVKGIRRAVADTVGDTRRESQTSRLGVQTEPEKTTSATTPRSSNLRLRKQFTEADEDRFLEESFEFIGRFFENSLEELEARNPGITGTFRRVSAEQFTAVVYRNGKAQARCRVRFGGRRGALGGITFSHSDSPSDNSYNESLSVEAGPQDLFLRAGFRFSGNGDKHLSQEGGAEYLWQMFIEPLQR